VLQRRQKYFTSRIVIPRDLRGQLGRVEITKSLRTTDPREAGRRNLLWEPHIGTLLNHLRRHGRGMKQHELEELTQRYLSASFDEIEDRLALDWSPAGIEVHSSHLNEQCHELSGALACADMSSAIKLAAEMAPEADELALRKLARRLIESRLQAAIAELRAVAGEPLRRPEAQQKAPAAEVPKAKPTPKVSEMAAMYAEERIAQGRWSPKTAKQGVTIFQLIAEMLGDPPIGEVTKAGIRKLGLDITKLPANMAKRYPGIPVAEVLIKTDGDGTVSRLESRSVNKQYQHVRTLFAWAAEHDYIAQSPAAVLHDVEEGRAQDARKVFEDEDIVAFFAEIVNKTKEPYGLWIPRIMAFTGCRMGEAAQLRKVDIRLEQGVAVFDFNEESDQKNLKTDGSTRCVPIHPRLLELGVLEFASGCPDGFLFPERVRFTTNPERGNMDLLSKQLNRWLRNAGVTDKRKSAQSFRGTLATRLKDLGVAEYHIAEVVGHENDNITSGRYGKRTNLPALRDVVARLQLPI
jgi:integrase